MRKNYVLISVFFLLNIFTLCAHLIKIVPLAFSPVSIIYLLFCLVLTFIAFAPWSIQLHKMVMKINWNISEDKVKENEEIIIFFIILGNIFIFLLSFYFVNIKH